MRESENILCPSQPLSREGNTGAYPKHPFPGGSEPHDSIHFESEAGIQLHQYPRQGFMHRQSPRPSETPFGRSHRLHLSAAGKIVLSPASGDDQDSRSSSDSQGSVKFHSIPPVSTVDGLHNKSIIGFRLKNLFEHGYPKTASPTRAGEATRLEMLRQTFLAGLDGPLKKNFVTRNLKILKSSYEKQTNTIIGTKLKKRKAVSELL